MHELTGAKPVLSVSRDYPLSENYTHVLGYVSMASEKDILNNEVIKNNHVPGLRVGKTGLEKSFENDIQQSDMSNFQMLLQLPLIMVVKNITFPTAFSAFAAWNKK